MDHSRQVYAGLRVLDLTDLSGSYAGKLLAELGADVLKVEPPGGDPARLYPPFAGGNPDRDRSLHWWYHNASKRSTTLDLTVEDGKNKLLALLDDADVLLDTSLPAAFESLGLGYNYLSSRNPRLIQASLTPFGLTGPRRDWKSTDLVASALGGLLYLGGVPEHPPSWPGGEQSYMIGAAALGVGVGIALQARTRTGRGQRVDVSLQEATAVATENAVGFWTFRKTIRARLGLGGFGGGRMIYEAKDGWVVVHVGGRWDALVDWIERGGFDVSKFRAPEWYLAEYRAAHMEEFAPTLQAFLHTKPKEEVYVEGQALRMVIGPIRSIAEVVAEPQLEARGFLVDLPAPQLGHTIKSGGAPYRLTKTPWRLRGSAPPFAAQLNGWEESAASSPRRHDTPDQFNRLPLRGIRVVDFGTNVVVPMVCKTLAAFGAEIIKIESRTRPEGQRNTLVPKPVGRETINTNWLFNNVNTDKNSIAMNLNVPEARDVLKGIIAKADVVIDNFGVDPMPKWGMTPDELWNLNPDLIIVRCSVMGRTGPRSNYVGLGNSIMGASGISALTGFEGDPPVATCTAHPDYSSNCHHTLFAILAALYHRDHTGEGQVVDLSQTESTICFVGPAILDWTVNGLSQGQNNNRHPAMAPHGVYRCHGEDRWLAIACPDEQSWQALARTVNPALLEDGRFATVARRKQHEDDLDAAISAWTVGQNAFAAMNAIQAAGVPAGVVQTGQDLVEADEHLAARGFFTAIQHEEAGEVVVMQPHMKLSDTPGRVGNPAPLLGEDTDWVVSELLGIDEERIGSLYVEGALE